jgi:hypothetical protein
VSGPERDMTLDGYRAILRGLKGMGYTCRPFDDARPDRQDLILRHDLDMSIAAAIELGRVEHEEGCRSTHFVLLRTEMYNPFSAEGLAGLAELAAMGHEIGLHFDASLYPADFAAMERAVDQECRILEAMTGRPVRVISFHRPSESALACKGVIAGRRHAYEPCFFKDMGYCSDSRGEWRFGHPFDNAAITGKQALQLLTHPIWWISGPNDTVQDKLDCFVQARTEKLAAELGANCLSYDTGRCAVLKGIIR